MGKKDEKKECSCWTVDEFRGCSEMFQEAVKFVKLAGSIADARAHGLCGHRHLSGYLRRSLQGPVSGARSPASRPPRQDRMSNDRRVGMP
jgi:hypothetical protein